MHLRVCSSLCLLALTLTAACDLGPGGNGSVVLLPRPGLPRYQQLGAIPVPEGFVSPAGGNFMHRRVDFTIDTLLGTRSVGATYNTADDAWRWSWELHDASNGDVLTDATGATYRLFTGPGSIGNRLFPGGHWVRVDATHMRSVGGLVHEFFPDGKLEAIYWQSADYPRLAYRTAQGGGVGPHVRVEQCLSAASCTLVYTIERDLLGRVAALEDRAGRRAEFSYDAQGRLAAARDPLDLANGWTGRVYEWSGPRLVAITNSEGERTEYESGWTTGQMRVVRQVGTPNRAHHFSYDPTRGARPLNEPSRVIHYRDPEGHVTTIHVDGHRRARSVQRPSGATTTYEYTGTSFELSAVTRPDGTRTEWAFEGETEVVRTDPSGNVVRMSVRLDDGENRAAPFQRPIDRIEDDLGVIEERGYDAQGRLEWLENGAGERTTFAYDAGNQVSSITPPHGVATSLSDYGEHGHAETIGAGGETQTRAFDAVGNLLSETGFDVLDLRPGGEVSREYDADRNVSKLWLAGAQAVEIESRSDGRRLAVRRPGAGDHEFVYDASGQLRERRERVDGVWRVTLLELDRLGHVTAEVLPNGMRRERSYTPDGELAGVRSLRNGIVEAEASLIWTDGRLAAVQDAAHGTPETLDYDTAGRLKAITFPGGETLERDYDLRSRQTSEVYRLLGGTTLRTLGFGFDGADRPTATLDGGLPLVRHTFRDGRLDTTVFGNGLTESFDYDPVSGVLDARTLSDAGGVLAFSSITQALASASAAVEVHVSTASPLAATGEVHHLGPDAATGGAGKRLVRSGGDDVAFDALSNLQSFGALSLAYNAEGNRLLSANDGQSAPLPYAYDLAGYVTERDGVALAWRADGRIASIGADVFEYDAFGRPTRRVVNGVERRFLFGGRVETDAAGAPLRLDLGSAVLELDSGATRYRHVDYRGNVDLITDASGDVVAHYEYDAYGVIALTGQDDGARSFAGGRLVQGLVVLGARVHDPLVGRFLAPDPVFQLANQFAYTSGNPVSWWDPSGLAPQMSPAARASFAKLTLSIVEGFSGGVIFVAGIVVATGGSELAGAAIATVGGALVVDGVGRAIETFGDLLSEDERQFQQQQGKPNGSDGVGATSSSVPATLHAPDPGGASCAGCGDVGAGGTGGAGLRGGFGLSLGGYGSGF